MQRYDQRTDETTSTRRRFMQGAAATGLSAAALSSGALGLPGASWAQTLDGPVNALTWGGHVEQQEVDDFLKETGVRVNFIGASGNSENLAKIKLGGGDQYDLVGVDALWVPKFYEEGVIDLIDLESWEQFDDMFDEFKSMSVWKVGNLWMGQPWAWSPLILWYNPQKITTPPTSIDFLWDPALRGRVAFSRQQEDVIAWMGIAAGVADPYNMNDQELAAAKQKLVDLVPNVLRFPPQEDELVRLMADESIWVTALSAGGALRIKESGGPDVTGFLPPEGYIGYFDGDCLVKGAAHRDAAIAWLKHRQQAKYVMQNFTRMRRPLAFRSPLEALKADGQGDLAHELFYDRPEIIGEMHVIGPPPNIGAYVDAFNEAVGG